MNWLSLLVPVILDIVKKILDNRLPKAVTGMKSTPAFCTDEECDALAGRLEVCLQSAPKNASPTSSEGGVIQHITDLIVALRAKDWAKIQTLLIDLIQHL